MFEKARLPRDAFAFSLRGLTTVAAYTVAPVIADDRISRIRDAQQNRSRATRSRMSRRIEDMLARYFAPGRPPLSQ